MNTPVISIIVPIYNVVRYIERCAESLFSIDYPNVEYIFVNDCTKDDSIIKLSEVVARYPAKQKNLRIINHEQNSGAGKARHTGLSAATGVYVWFVDSDDYVEKTAINQLMPYIVDGYDLISFSFIRDYGGRQERKLIKEITIERLLRTQVEAALWKCLIKRSLFEEYDVRPIEGLNYAEDFLLTAKFALVAKKQITLCDKYLYYYNCENEESLMHKKNIKLFENGADAAISVYNFYKSQNANKKYSGELGAMLVHKYFELESFDHSNQKVSELLTAIKDTDRIYYMILKMPKALGICYNLARLYKFISIGRDVDC